MAVLRSIFSVLLISVPVSLPFLFITYLGGQNHAPAVIGVLFWITVAVVGFPWNIFIGIAAADLESRYAPGLFFSLNENHDRTVGMFMAIGALSSYLNCLLASIAIYVRIRRKASVGRQDQ